MAKRTQTPEDLELNNEVDNDEDEGRFMNSNEDVQDTADDEDLDTETDGMRGEKEGRGNQGGGGGQGNQGGRQGQGGSSGGGSKQGQGQGSSQGQGGGQGNKGGGSTGKKK